ncbi:MAG: hypothetical protein ACYCX8_07165 [Acidimicrobiales bacterium]
MKQSSSTACRLYEIIKTAKEYSRRSINATFKEGWKNVLSLETDSTIDIIRNVLEVSYLVKETKKQIIANSGDDDEANHILTNYDQIELATTPTDINKEFRLIIGGIDNETLVYLSFGCKLLLKKSPEVVISDEDLRKISEDIDLLFNETLNSRIDQSVKSYILESLARIMDCIRLYRIRGTKGLREELFITAGYYNDNRDNIEKTQSTDSCGSNIVTKFMGILNGFNIVEQAINNAIPLACLATPYIMLPKL